MPGSTASRRRVGSGKPCRHPGADADDVRRRRDRVHRDEAGAQGYLLKEAEQADIVRAVRGVIAGEAIFGQGVAERVLGNFAEPPAPVSSEYPFPS